LVARDIEALGAAARVRTVERFSWNRVFEDLSSVYAEVSGEAAFAVPGGMRATH
jgi:alpha-1,6-mannosyltransferase